MFDCLFSKCTFGAGVCSCFAGLLQFHRLRLVSSFFFFHEPRALFFLYNFRSFRIREASAAFWIARNLTDTRVRLPGSLWSNVAATSSVSIHSWDGTSTLIDIEKLTLNVHGERPPLKLSSNYLNTRIWSHTLSSTAVGVQSQFRGTRTPYAGSIEYEVLTSKTGLLTSVFHNSLFLSHAHKPLLVRELVFVDFPNKLRRRMKILLRTRFEGPAVGDD